MEVLPVGYPRFRNVSFETNYVEEEEEEEEDNEPSSNGKEEEEEDGGAPRRRWTWLLDIVRPVDDGSRWRRWMRNFPVFGGAVLLWLAVAWAFQRSIPANSAAKDRWTSFAQYLAETRPCSPGMSDALNTKTFGFVVEELAMRQSQLGDDDNWASRLWCATFDANQAPCYCMLKTSATELVELCSPRVVDWSSGAALIYDDWFGDMQPVFVPHNVTFEDDCSKTRVEVSNDTAYLLVRAVQFLNREPDSRALFLRRPM